jgi:hypothetical protein
MEIKMKRVGKDCRGIWRDRKKRNKKGVEREHS